MTYLFIELESGVRIYTSDLYYMESIYRDVQGYHTHQTLCNEILVNTEVCKVVGMEIASPSILAIPTEAVSKCYLVSRDASP